MYTYYHKFEFKIIARLNCMDDFGKLICAVDEYLILLQRLAESLDADVKRWATGKEGNLRALLSTLQYVCTLSQYTTDIICQSLLEFFNIYWQ